MMSLLSPRFDRFVFPTLGMACLILSGFFAAVASVPPAQARQEAVPPQTQPAVGRPIRIVTWNCDALFTTDEVKRRKSDFIKMVAEVQPDVILLQEVTSQAVLEAVRDVIGWTKADGSPADAVCSSFNPDHTQEYNSLEVGVISRFPIVEAVEFDTELDNPPSERQVVERQLTIPSRLNPPPNFRGRGFLRVRTSSPDLVLYSVHLKSSRGQFGRQDVNNAIQREYVIGALALDATAIRGDYPNHDVIIGGDFNVGITDRDKLANSWEVEAARRKGQAYDRTHALLTGLIDGCRFRPLCEGVGETYVKGANRFKGAGAIDNLYVDGPHRDRFRPAKPARSSYGSDHLPVWTEFTPVP